MAHVGIWLAKDRLVAVADGDEAEGSPIVAERADDARWALLEHFDRNLGLDWELVLPDDLARTDSIASLALERRISSWVAPRDLVDAIRFAAALTRPPQIARMLARLPAYPPLRSLMECHVALGGRRQLTIW
jgi:hypothetical protein